MRYVPIVLTDIITSNQHIYQTLDLYWYRQIFRAIPILHALTYKLINFREIGEK